MKKVILGLIIIIALVLGGGFFALSTGKTVNVEYSEADYTSALTKSSVAIADIKEINLIALATKNYTTTGENEIDTRFSNAEMSAIIDMANAEGGPISDFRVSFNGGNSGEISFKLTDTFLDFIKEQNMISLPNNSHAHNLKWLPVVSAGDISDTVINFITNVAANKPVYASGSLSRTSDKSVSVNISSLKVGQISMSAEVVARVETEVVNFVNRVLSSTNGFTIEELRVEDGALYYKGTLPAEIQGKKIN